MEQDANSAPGILRRRIHGRMVEITRTGGRRRAFEVRVEGETIRSGTLRRRRGYDDPDDDLMYEVAVRGHAAVPLTIDEHEILVRPRRPRKAAPACAGCGGPLNEHGLEGIDLGDAGRYCFDCT
jgi:hypothetical protein